MLECGLRDGAQNEENKEKGKETKNDRISKAKKLSSNVPRVTR
jgi:hypothetical protein